ncbi:MAG: hypothetical protein M1812_003708 [Candelaria pacifica]|nr:MAG: hypothetical protein M1812_003708 [Candelaria pacifica]
MPALTKRKLAQRKRRLNDDSQSAGSPRKKRCLHIPTNIPLELIFHILKFVDIPYQRNMERALPQLYKEYGGAIFRSVVECQFPIEAKLFGPMPDFNGFRRGTQTLEEERILRDAVFATIKFRQQRNLESALDDVQFSSSDTGYEEEYPEIIKGGRPFLEFLAQLRGCVRLTATMLADLVRSEGRDKRLLSYRPHWRAKFHYLTPIRLRKIEWHASELEMRLQLDKYHLYESVLTFWRAGWRGTVVGSVTLTQSKKQQRHYDMLLQLVYETISEICGLDQICDQVNCSQLQRIDSDTGPTPLTEVQWKLDRERFVRKILHDGVHLIWRNLEWAYASMKTRISGRYVDRLRNLGHMAPEA